MVTFDLEDAEDIQRALLFLKHTQKRFPSYEVFNWLSDNVKEWVNQIDE